MKLYASYMFKDKDPAIDELRTVMQDANGGKRITHAQLKQIEVDGGPTKGCMAQWFWGKTKRPQNATIEAAGRAMGLRRVWIENAVTVSRQPVAMKKKPVKRSRNAA